MSWTRSTAMVIGLVLVALPVSASVALLNLQEYMEITVDTVHGKITAKETFRADWPEEHTYFTRLTIEGESVRLGGEPRSYEVVFMGSHDPADDFYHSEAPQPQDVRLGNEVVVFFARQPKLLPEQGGVDYVWAHDGVYRVERAFGEPVLVGKGEGFAFPANVKLGEAMTRVAETHQLILAERALQAAPAGK